MSKIYETATIWRDQYPHGWRITFRTPNGFTTTSNKTYRRLEIAQQDAELEADTVELMGQDDSPAAPSYVPKRDYDEIVASQEKTAEAIASMQDIDDIPEDDPRSLPIVE